MYAVLIVTIIGIICIVISFIMVGSDEIKEDKNENEDGINGKLITEAYELDEEEIAILHRKVGEKISGEVDDIIYNADNSLSTMTNEKMMALGDYAVTVCDEIEKNHKEVMFLYSMLSDKEKELKELVAEVENKASELRRVNDLAFDTYARTDSDLDTLDESEETETEDTMQMIEEEPVDEEDNTNDIILEMNRNGMGIMEIARQLGLGVGEVKLVIDLYRGNAG